MGALCSPFEPSVTFYSSAPMERNLAPAACRAVVSLSKKAPWLTLKAAASITTKRHMCARLLPLPRHVLHRPTGILTVGVVLWQGWVSFAPNRTHACNVPSPP